MGSKEGSRGPIIKVENLAEEKAQKRADQVGENFSMGGFNVLDRLAEEVTGMSLAGRFSRTGKIRDRRLNSTTPEPTLGSTLDLSETDQKKQELQGKIASIKDQLAQLTGQLQSVVMEIEASKQEG